MKKIILVLVVLNSCIHAKSATAQNMATEMPGIYSTDASKKNMHSFRHFTLDLKIEAAAIKLYFVSSREYRDSIYWKKGDLYAYTDKIGAINDTLKLNLYEARGGNKIRTEYKILIETNGFQIMTAGGNKTYIDHYMKGVKKQNTSYNAIGFRDVTPKELQQLYFEYQSGMELIFWLAELKKANIENTDLFNGIVKSLDSINKGVEFPIAEYNNYRDLTHVLGFTLGEILHKDYDWKWKYKEIYDNDYLGFVIVSPNETIGLKVEHYFYANVMYHRDIKLQEFIKNINNTEIQANGFHFYEPWMKK